MMTEVHKVVNARPMEKSVGIRTSATINKSEIKPCIRKNKQCYFKQYYN